MLQVREMRFHCSNGLEVLRICAPLEGALVAKTALCWQQCFFLLMFLYTLGVDKLVQWKSHLQKIKNTNEPQNQFVVSIQIW